MARKKPETLIREANALAHRFYAEHGYRAPEGFRFDRATHPQERMMWRLAVLAYEALKRTDLDDVLSEIED